MTSYEMLDGGQPERRPEDKPGRKDSERIWRCACGWPHFLSIIHIAGESYLELGGSFRPTTLREKLRAVYEIFRRGHYDTWLEVELDKQTAIEIDQYLRTFIYEEPR